MRTPRIGSGRTARLLLAAAMAFAGVATAPRQAAAWRPAVDVVDLDVDPSGWACFLEQHWTSEGITFFTGARRYRVRMMVIERPYVAPPRRTSVTLEVDGRARTRGARRNDDFAAVEVELRPGDVEWIAGGRSIAVRLGARVLAEGSLGGIREGLRELRACARRMRDG